MSKLAIYPVVLALALLFNYSSSAQPQPNFSKSGDVHKQVLEAWNNQYREYYAGEIQRRLFEEGDVYVLYDVQIGGLQSFVEMTRRCKDVQQIAELVTLLRPVLFALKPIPGSNNSTGWICSGGKTCTAYRFIGNEVPLCSVQFLGLLGALATNITENIPTRQQTAEQKAFLKETFSTMSIQLDRWLTAGYFTSVEKRLGVTADEVKGRNAGYYFSDKDLWYLTVLSDLSELHLAGIQAGTDDGNKAFTTLQNKRVQIQKIFDLFLARTFLNPLPNGKRAEIDKGFWAYHYDNRYAGYTGATSPVTWVPDSNGISKMQILVAWDSSHLAPHTGWDISHARRLVPALETLTRNKENIKKVWGYSNPSFDPVAIREAYANQIVEEIWNGDTEFPLFSNFWSGDNGWYRVAYASQTGRQSPGNPPYGLSVSMPSGGYATWGAFQPTLKKVFRRIFDLTQKKEPNATSFIQQYYRSFSNEGAESAFIPTRQSFAFLSDLVALPAAERRQSK